jgi:hypothetical protein
MASCVIVGVLVSSSAALQPISWSWPHITGVLKRMVVHSMPTLKPGELRFYIGVYSPKRVDPCLKTPPPFFARENTSPGSSEEACATRATAPSFLEESNPPHPTVRGPL